MSVVQFTGSSRSSGNLSIGRGGQQGIALIVVLWLIVLLGAVAAGHASNVHSEIRLAMLYVQSAKARALAEAGIQQAILSLLQGSEGKQWPVDGSVQRFVFGEQEVKVAIRDATGLVDLNSAKASLLEVLFSIPEQNSQQQVQLVNALLDWRDADDRSHLQGAEDDDYRAAGFAWTAHDAAFSSIEELRYLIGMTPRKFAAIAPYITVFSGQAALNLEYAPKKLASILTGQTMDAVPNRSSTLSTQHRFQGSPAPRRGTYHIYAGTHAGTHAGTTGSSDVFTSIEAVVKISASADKPYTVLNWQLPARFNFEPGE
jgi:type II secretory pathway component PulK